MSGHASTGGGVESGMEPSQCSADLERVRAKIMALRRDCEALMREKSRREGLRQAQDRQKAAVGQRWDNLRTAVESSLAALQALKAGYLSLQQTWQEHLATKSPLNFEAFSDRLDEWRQSCGQSLGECQNCGQWLTVFIGECQQAGCSTIEGKARDLLGIVGTHETYLKDGLNNVQDVQDGLGRALAEQLEDKVFECPICMMETSLEDVFRMSKCGHQLCRQCAQHTVRNDLNCGLMPLVCPQCKADPCDSCPIKEVGEQQNLEVKHCKLEEADLAMVLSPEDLDRYYRAQMTIAVNASNGTLVRCPAKDCFNIIAKEPEDCHCVCNACQYAWCDACHVDWHEGSTCEQYQEWKAKNEKADEDMEKLKSEGKVKECPNCHQWGVRGSGECNATWCLHCKGTFCWLCGVSLSHTKNPHSHFAEQGPCYEKLFEGVH